jgi:hypothetical protein
MASVVPKALKTRREDVIRVAGNRELDVRAPGTVAQKIDLQLHRNMPVGTQMQHFLVETGH